jgi:hypothetical protein
MSPNSQDELAQARAAGAMEEREAILALLERYSRRFLYGHGETGAHVLLRLADEIRERGGSTASRPVDDT